MANCHELFGRFQGTIRLPASKRETLRQGRNAIRDLIRSHFSKELQEPMPRFRMQGSFAMRTVIVPLEGDYDLDDGVYLTGVAESKPDWPSPELAHSWICSAVEDHTDAGVLDMPKCVRVPYAGDYHVDLPTYIMLEDEPYLADTARSEWVLSDAGALVDWFDGEVAEKGDQLRRTVRLLKAWSEWAFDDGSSPTGIILTGLACRGFVAYGDRDDSAFGRVAVSAAETLEQIQWLPNPVDPDENLLLGLESKMPAILGGFGHLAENCESALAETSRKRACHIWRDTVFGRRFPGCADVTDATEALRPKRFTVLGRDDERSAECDQRVLRNSV